MEDIRQIQSDMMKYFLASHSDILDEIRETKEISDALEAKIKVAVTDFMKGLWGYAIN